MLADIIRLKDGELSEKWERVWMWGLVIGDEGRKMV